MGPDESAELAAKTARVRGRKPVPEVAEAAQKVRERERAENLDDPETQRKIEFPHDLRYTLDLGERGEHEIIVKAAFSFADVQDRGVLEDLESFQRLVGGELAKYGHDSGDVDWLKNNPHMLDVVLTKSTIKRDARAILVKLARYAEPWKTIDAKNNESLHARPTIDELADGLDSVVMIAVALFLLGRFKQEVDSRKKSQKAAVQA